MVNVRIVWLIVFYLFSGLAFSKTNFVTISLPEYVTVDLPRNWVLISNNKRITLDTWVESTFDINKLKNVDSSLPFAANYYENGGTVGIINSRYYPDIEISQKDAKQATSADVLELDQELRKNMLSSMEKIGMAVTSWEGTEKRTINGLTAFITEYHRKSLKGSGIFRVRLVRVLAGSSSFTLTVSYLESQSLLLKNITDRIISSLKMRGYQ
tara:strand:- start:2090 stop:2725 length:636 start_codon:yes stop_codon:yes gene_type:complete